jgi:NAD(P)-dependent dehydrogenase (short-subunit alcohol dehydrogenase family)
MKSDNRAAIVTGAGQGIGRTIAVELASEGTDVLIADISPEEMDETKRLVEEHGQTAVCQYTDLREEEDVDAAVERAREAFGRIDILVNNSGISGPTLPAEDILTEDWDNTLGVNLRGTFLITREVLPTMKEQEYGRIVNVASATAKRPVEHRTPYAASKSGLIGFTRSLAAEVGRDNINVNVICPGSVEGDRIERVFRNHAEAAGVPYEEVKGAELDKSARKELVRPESVATVVSFLCSEDASQITGQDINVSAGKIMY